MIAAGSWTRVLRKHPDTGGEGRIPHSELLEPGADQDRPVRAV